MASPYHVASLYVPLIFLFLLFVCFAFFSYILALLTGPCFRDHIVADSKQKQGFEGEKGIFTISNQTAFLS